MTDSIEDRVYTFVAEERGMRRGKLSPDATLSHDLGIEGDDAVDFFEQFSTKFSVDPNRLNEDWRCYFGSEGIGPVGALYVLVPSVALAWLLRLVAPALPFWVCIGIGLVLWLGTIHYWQKAHPDKWRAQISVQDLIDCAKAGRWIKEVPAEIKAKIASSEG
jgi:hypothetical protein